MRRAAPGFTLLEVMIALVIIATALVALLSLHGRSIQIVAYDQSLNRASLLASDLMTRVLLDNPFPDLGETNGRFEENPDFAWIVDVTRALEDDFGDELRQVRVRVFWDPEDTEAASLVTLVRDPEPEVRTQ